MAVSSPALRDYLLAPQAAAVVTSLRPRPVSASEKALLVKPPSKGDASRNAHSRLSTNANRPGSRATTAKPSEQSKSKRAELHIPSSHAGRVRSPADADKAAGGKDKPSNEDFLAHVHAHQLGAWDDNETQYHTVMRENLVQESVTRPSRPRPPVPELQWPRQSSAQSDRGHTSGDGATQLSSQRTWLIQKRNTVMHTRTIIHGQIRAWKPLILPETKKGHYAVRRHPSFSLPS
jgi:hypothetical protein